METAARKLFQVVKDHDNQMMLEMVLASNNICIASCQTTSAEESEGDGHEPIKRPHYPTSPCHVIVINTNEFDSPLYEAVEKLKSDGLTLEIDSWGTAQLDGPCLSSNNELVETVKKIGALMTVCTHALNKGDVYIKAPGAAMTYIKMMDFGSYLPAN